MIVPVLLLLVAGAPGLAGAADASAPEVVQAPAAAPLALPGGTGGLDLDDLRYDPGLDRVLVPAAAAGTLDLIDPATEAVTPVVDFGAGAPPQVTSADVGAGLIFTADRAQPRLFALDAVSHAVVATAPLAGPPDYVRFVAPRRAVWVWEAHAGRNEIFTLSETSPPTLAARGAIEIPGGPESLVVDARRGRAYSNLWRAETLAIDLSSHAIVERWSAGCDGPRGLALDADGGFLFVGCREGAAVALDVAHGGRVASRLATGAGVDIVAWDAARRHLYVPGSRSATLEFVAVSPAGELSLLGSAATVARSHCVATDGRGKVYVCDPEGGRLLVFRDPFPPAR
jgi:hypothetical protein